VAGVLCICDVLGRADAAHFFRYVAIESMEKEYAQSIYVNSINGGVLVVADGEMDRAVLVAQANMIEVQKLAAELEIEGSELELCRNPIIVKAVLADMVKTAMKNLSPLEKIVAGDSTWLAL
jgi:long-subunit acyl-CoA synthetase (AMP-forming)